jgi:GntR family transcriptional regulator
MLRVMTERPSALLMDRIAMSTIKRKTRSRRASQTEELGEAEILQVTQVERDSPIPAYLQVEQDLRRLCRAGAALKVPAETELAAMYGVSRVTVRQSLERLAAAGLVRREHGRGTTLMPRPDLGLDLSLFRSVTDQLRETGLTGKVKTLQRALTTAPPEGAAALQLKPKEKAVLLKRLLLANGVPVAIISSWFPAKRVPGLQKVQLENDSVWAYLADTYGLVVTSTRNAIEVIESGVAEAQVLQVDYATPLIKLASCFSDKLNRPIEYSVSLWRSAQMKFTFSQHL